MRFSFLARASARESISGGIVIESVLVVRMEIIYSTTKQYSSLWQNSGVAEVLDWLFAGIEAAAHRTAILCSLVQTCKHLQINPFVYLRDVIERVSTHPARRVLELTPREWKRVRQNSRTQAAV